MSHLYTLQRSLLPFRDISYQEQVDMADHDIQMEDIDATGLRKLPDQRLNEIEFDSQGTVYDDLFIKLQIRPDSCQEFLRKNLRPYRNKSKHQKLIAKGDSESLRKLSDSFITAFGNLVWAKNRRWLLRPDELDEGEQPLQYVPPSKRKEGDHEKYVTAACTPKVQSMVKVLMELQIF